MRLPGDKDKSLTFPLFDDVVVDVALLNSAERRLTSVTVDFLLILLLLVVVDVAVAAVTIDVRLRLLLRERHAKDVAEGAATAAVTVDDVAVDAVLRFLLLLLLLLLLL